MLRRINIRIVRSVRGRFRMKHYRDFLAFKKWVRENIDRPMLRKMLPFGSILKDVFTELHIGNFTYARQIGSYPLLTVLPYKYPLNRFLDVKVIDYGHRSVTAVEYPLNINTASVKALQALPSIGKKRAFAIARKRPFNSIEELNILLGSDVVDNIKNFICL